MEENNPYKKIEKHHLSGTWNGYCPESWLKGKTVRMRLNSWDFYESEETGLQIAVLGGVQAVVLNFRGSGDFRKTPAYGDEVEMGQLLSPQNLEEAPFNEPLEVFKDSAEIEAYINSIKSSFPSVVVEDNSVEGHLGLLNDFWNDINGGYQFPSVEERFESHVHYLTNCLCLVVGNHPYRIVECEIYYYDKDKHPDPYVHKRKQQLTAGKWYFNDMGLDITFGDRGKEIYASILIAGIRSLKTNEYISGTANVVREIFDNLGTVIQDGNGICLREASAGVLVEENAIRATRVGLTKKEADTQNFIDKKYRYLLELTPAHNFSKKEDVVKQMLKTGSITKGETKDILGYNLGS